MESSPVVFIPTPIAITSVMPMKVLVLPPVLPLPLGPGLALRAIRQVPTYPTPGRRALRVGIEIPAAASTDRAEPEPPVIPLGLGGVPEPPAAIQPEDTDTPWHQFDSHLENVIAPIPRVDLGPAVRNRLGHVVILVVPRPCLRVRCGSADVVTAIPPSQVLDMAASGPIRAPGTYMRGSIYRSVPSYHLFGLSITQGSKIRLHRASSVPLRTGRASGNPSRRPTSRLFAPRGELVAVRRV